MGTLLNRASFNLSSTSGGSSGLFVYTFYSTVTEVTDDITNTSTLTAKLTYKGDTTGKLFNGSGFTATLQYSLDDTNWTKIASASRDTYTGTSEVTLVSGTSVTIRHNDDGKKTIYYRVVVTNNGNSYAPRSGNHKWTINLTDIPRGHQFKLNKTMLTAGEIATLTIEKNVASYTSSVVWQRGEQSGVLLNKSDATTLEIPYATITQGMATGVSATVILLCTTFNGDTEVSTVRLDIVVSSGHIALSLYDDGEGNVGATIGERAVKDGFNVKVQSEFDEDVYFHAKVYGINLDDFELTPASVSKIGGVKSGGDIDVSNTGSVSVVSIGGKKIMVDTTANWSKQTSFVPTAGTIIVYSDGATGADGKRISKMKIGDGDAYVVDLPFVSQDIYDALNAHITNNKVHITEAERNFWNNKVTADVTGNNLILTKL